MLVFGASSYLVVEVALVNCLLLMVSGVKPLVSPRVVVLGLVRDSLLETVMVPRKCLWKSGSVVRVVVTCLLLEKL